MTLRQTRPRIKLNSQTCVLLRSQVWNEIGGGASSVVPLKIYKFII
jgi:hypothetical protein